MATNKERIMKYLGAHRFATGTALRNRCRSKAKNGKQQVTKDLGEMVRDGILSRAWVNGRKFRYSLKVAQQFDAREILAKAKTTDNYTFLEYMKSSAPPPAIATAGIAAYWADTDQKNDFDSWWKRDGVVNSVLTLHKHKFCHTDEIYGIIKDIAASAYSSALEMK